MTNSLDEGKFNGSGGGGIDYPTFDPNGIFPNIVYIPVDRISVVWVESQRPYNAKRAKMIADDFDPSRFGLISVTKADENGIHHACDGQTRVGGVKIRFGMEAYVPCQVSVESDPALAAEAFINNNKDRKAVSAIDNFNVSVAAGYQPETAVIAIVRDCGYEIASRGDDTISAVKALKQVYVSYGAEVLGLTLRVLRETWAGTDESTSGNILLGFGLFLHKYGQTIDRRRFVEVTQNKWTPGTLLVIAKSGKDMFKLTTAEAMTMALLRNYNEKVCPRSPLGEKPK